MNSKLIFLKLGGSLITDKARAETALPDLIITLLSDLKQFMLENPEQKVLLGHGSGSFGHHAAAKYHTRDSVSNREEWHGFAEVWHSARKLNQIVLETGRQAGLDLIAFPPSASILLENKKLKNWNLEPLKMALQEGLIPLIYGDVVFDEKLGGTILSTEELFAHLAKDLKPARILLAGKETAVFADFPQNQKPIPLIDKDAKLEATLQSSENQDVTGGMRAKVEEMQTLCRAIPGIQIEIFHAEAKNDLHNALTGHHSGTIIS